MTKVVFFGLEDFSSVVSPSVFAYSTLVSSSSTSYVFRNSSGELVTVTGSDFQVNGFGRFVSGEINAISIAPSGNDAGVNVRITQLNFDGTELFGVGGADVPSESEQWYTVFAGNVDLQTRTDAQLAIGLDGYWIQDSTRLEGGNNSAKDDFGENSLIVGGLIDAYNDSQFIGGRFEFSGQAETVVGDVDTIRNNAVVRGGDDTLIYIRGSEFPSLLDNSSLFWVGDVSDAAQSTTVFGGDDRIDMTGARASGGTSIFGDVWFAQSTTTVVGGDDHLTGSRTRENVISGDVGAIQDGMAFQGGDDTIFGGSKADLLYGDHENTGDGFIGGDDRIYGGNGADSIFGNGGDDLLFDAFGAGAIYGGDGDDRFRPLDNGAHTFDGGDGIDMLDYSASSTKVIIDLDAQTVSGGWGDNDVFSNVEAARGSQRGDTIFGTDGRDTIYGNTGNDSLDGGSGADKLYAGAGSDQLVSGRGNDQYFGGQGFDVLDYRTSGAGVRVNVEKNKFAGGHANGDSARGVENIFGSQFKDKLHGDNKANFLRGRDGNDIMRGDKGVDRLLGQNGDDKIFGGGGQDRTFGGKGRDEIYGGRGDDIMKGGRGRDEFHFRRGDDFDRIRDFENNRDTLVLTDVGRRPFKNAEKVGNDVYIDFGNGDQLYIDDITIRQLRNDIEFG